MKFRFISAGLAGLGFLLVGLLPSNLRSQDSPQSQKQRLGRKAQETTRGHS